MKVPKYIEDALNRRARAADIFQKADDIISDFIDKNHIEVPMEDYCGGVESYVNPWESIDSIRFCIEKHEK